MVKLNKQSNLEFELARDYCKNSFEEFILLTTMDRKILSNSTFSWWAGYLSQGTNIIMAPEPLSLEQINGKAKSPSFTYLNNQY